MRGRRARARCPPEVTMNDAREVTSRSVPTVITPAVHAVLDYSVAATFFALGAAFAGGHRRAATLAFINGAMVLGMSMLTDYPGGLYRTLSFRTHRTGDMLQAAVAGLGPTLMGFAGDP